MSAMCAVDSTALTAWHCDAKPKSFEKDFSALSTADQPAAGQQPLQASLILCKASSLLWRIIISSGPDHSPKMVGHAQVISISLMTDMQCPCA